MKELKRFFAFIIRQFKDRPVFNYAAQMTYGALLAFTPLIMLFFNILSLFPAESGNLNLKTIIPEFLTPLIETAAVNARNPYHSAASNIVYMFFILYFSVYVLRLFLLTNTKVMGIKESRSIPVSYLKSILYLLIVITMVMLFIGVYFVIKKVMVNFFITVNIYTHIESIWQIFSFLIIAAVLTVLFAFLYMYSPPVKMPFVTAIPGSIFVSISWMIVTILSKNALAGVLDSATITGAIEWPFIVVISVFTACLILVLGMLINMYFIQTGRTHYEIEQ